MREFSTGNVIKNRRGTIEIVSNTNKTDYIETIFLDHSNASAGHRKEDYDIENTCHNCDNCNPDPECELCKGTGTYKTTIYGYKHSVLIASTVKQYILNSLTKNFNF